MNVLKYRKKQKYISHVESEAFRLFPSLVFSGTLLFVLAVKGQHCYYHTSKGCKKYWFLSCKENCSIGLCIRLENVRLWPRLLRGTIYKETLSKQKSIFINIEKQLESVCKSLRIHKKNSISYLTFIYTYKHIKNWSTPWFLWNNFVLVGHYQSV